METKMITVTGLQFKQNGKIIGNGTVFGNGDFSVSDVLDEGMSQMGVTCNQMKIKGNMKASFQGNRELTLSVFDNRFIITGNEPMVNIFTPIRKLSAM